MPYVRLGSKSILYLLFQAPGQCSLKIIRSCCANHALSAWNNTLFLTSKHCTSSGSSWIVLNLPFGGSYGALPRLFHAFCALCSPCLPRCVLAVLVISFGPTCQWCSTISVAPQTRPNALPRSLDPFTQGTELHLLTAVLSHFHMFLEELSVAPT